MIPEVPSVQFETPVLEPEAPDAMRHPLEPKKGLRFNGPWQRWFVQVRNILQSLVGNSRDAKVIYLHIPYGFRSALRLSIPQAALASLSLPPNPLGQSDTGLLVCITDYNHILEWNGNGWQWGPGDLGSGLVVQFVVPPTAAGWRICDGVGAVAYLKSDGTLATIPTPTAPGFYFRQ